MSLTMSRSTVKRAAKNYVATPGDNTRVVEQFFTDLDTPKSLAAHLLFQAGEHRQLLDLDVNPSDYSNADDFHRDYLAYRSFRKVVR